MIKARLNINMDPDLLENFRKYVDSRHTTMTDVVTGAIIALLERRGDSIHSGEIRIRPADGISLTFSRTQDGLTEVTVSRE